MLLSWGCSNEVWPPTKRRKKSTNFSGANFLGRGFCRSPPHPSSGNSKNLPFKSKRIRSRTGKPNQRKANSQAGSRMWFFFFEFGVFFLEKHSKFTPDSRTAPIFVNSPCFSRKKHSEFTRTPQIREPACESAILWFGLPGRPWGIIPKIPRYSADIRRIFNLKVCVLHSFLVLTRSIMIQLRRCITLLMGRVYIPSNQQKNITLQTYCDTNESCILLLFTNVTVRGWKTDVEQSDRSSGQSEQQSEQQPEQSQHSKQSEPCTVSGTRQNSRPVGRNDTDQNTLKVAPSHWGMTSDARNKHTLGHDQWCRNKHTQICSLSLRMTALLSVPSMEPYCETKWVERNGIRTGPAHEIGRNPPELATRTNWSKSPSEHQLAGKKPWHRGNFWTKEKLHGCNGQIVGQPRKRNFDKMSKKYRENVQKLSGGAENTIFGHFLENFCLFGGCFCLVTLSNARPLQLHGVTPNPFDLLKLCCANLGGLELAEFLGKQKVLQDSYEVSDLMGLTIGRRTEQMKTGQVNLDHLSMTGRFSGHFHGRLRSTVCILGAL